MNNYDDIFTANGEKKESKTERPFDKEEWAAKKQQERTEAFEMLDNATEEAVANPETFRNYLLIQSRFGKYSVSNALLISYQNNGATYLADFETWKEKSVFVQKGERGITLLEPGNEFTREDGLTGFSINVKKVFDISQTNSEHALKLFIRFALAKGVITYGLELMLKLMVIVQGVISKIMTASGIAGSSSAALPQSIIDAIEDCGFWESIPLWAVTLIGGLFITVLSFIMIMSVYGRFFKIYMYSAIAPVPLSTFAGQPTENVGKTFLKSYCAVLLEGAIIVLACVIFSVFASSPPTVDTSAAAVTQVWSYVGELIFNMLVLVGSVKMADRIVREMMGL